MIQSVREAQSDGRMTHEEAVSHASEVAEQLLAPAAAQNDKAGRFSTEAVEALGRACCSA